MTVEEIYLRLKDELTAENESSASPERIFIKNEEQTICTLGMNRSHEIIFVEFKPSPKDLQDIEKEGFVHPHPVEMLHDAGWRQAQITTWEEAEKLLEIIHRSYKRRRPKAVAEDGAVGEQRGRARGRGKGARRVPPVTAGSTGEPEKRIRAVDKPAAASAQPRAGKGGKKQVAEKKAAPPAAAKGKKPVPAAPPKKRPAASAAKPEPKKKPGKVTKKAAGKAKEVVKKTTAKTAPAPKPKPKPKAKAKPAPKSKAKAKKK
jgi:hypothetical protein